MNDVCLSELSCVAASLKETLALLDGNLDHDTHRVWTEDAFAINALVSELATYEQALVSSLMKREPRLFGTIEQEYELMHLEPAIRSGWRRILSVAIDAIVKADRTATAERFCFLHADMDGCYRELHPETGGKEACPFYRTIKGLDTGDDSLSGEYQLSRVVREGVAQ